MRLRPADILPALLLLALTATADARESDRTQPMSVEADQTDTVLTDDGESRLTGNVAITQGTLRIAAGTAVITRKGGDIVKVTLEGSPATMQQEDDAGAMMQARGNRIEYDVIAESVVMSGNVSVDQGGDTFRSQRLTYDMKNGRLSGQGDGSSDGRVRMTIQPRPASAPAKDEGGTP